MDGDPFFVDDGDIDAARVLLIEANEAEMSLYPGDKHLFADSSLPSYDAEATGFLMGQVLEFLAAS
jgi:dienelactone hydrolase